MMMRIPGGAVVAALCATTIFAHADPIAERSATMKGVGKVFYSDMGKMAKGETPYDQAKVDAALAHISGAAEKLPSLYPETSKTGGDTEALPRVWETKDDFVARYHKLGAEVEARKSQIRDVDSLKAGYAAINKNCVGCHELYRARKS